MMVGVMLLGTTGAGSSGSSTDGLGGLNKDHELVRHVPQNSGVQDPEQSKQYTQHGVEVLNEQSNHNPQELQSAIGRFLGGGESGKHTGSGSGGTEHMFDI